MRTAQNLFPRSPRLSLTLAPTLFSFVDSSVVKTSIFRGAAAWHGSGRRLRLGSTYEGSHKTVVRNSTFHLRASFTCSRRRTVYWYVGDIKNHVRRTAYPQSFIPRCLSRNWKALGSDCSWIQRMVQLQAPGNHQNRQANIISPARFTLLFRPKNKCANNNQSRTLFSLSRHDASKSKLKLLNVSTYFMPHNSQNESHETWGMWTRTSSFERKIFRS